MAANCTHERSYTYFDRFYNAWVWECPGCLVTNFERVGN
jgi:hypothetical protein